MRSFHSLPEPGGAQGAGHQTTQDIPHHVIKLHPGGGSITHATPDLGGPDTDGPWTYRQPVTSVRAAQVHKAGRP
jgi:hypothetical protein